MERGREGGRWRGGESETQRERGRARAKGQKLTLPEINGWMVAHQKKKRQFDRASGLSAVAMADGYGGGAISTSRSARRWEKMEST